MDAKLLELRLVSKESTVGGYSVTRCAKALRDFYGGVEAADASDSASLSVLHESFTRELMLYQLEISKSLKLLNVWDKEIVEFEKKDDHFESVIESTTGDIVDLTMQLETEKNIRKFRLMCETNAKDVVALPSTRVSKRKLADCEDTIAGLNVTLGTTEKRLSQRTKQFESLLESISSLITPLDEEQQAINEDNIEEEDDDDEPVGEREGGRNELQNRTANCTGTDLLEDTEEGQDEGEKEKSGVEVDDKSDDMKVETTETTETQSDDMDMSANDTASADTNSTAQQQQSME